MLFVKLFSKKNNLNLLVKSRASLSSILRSGSKSLGFTCFAYLSTFQKNLSVMPKKALVLLAEGAEEMETVITTDIMRRGGIDVTVAGVAGPDPVKCSRNVVIVPDLSLDDAIANGPYDAVIVPGGAGGAKILATDSKVGNILKEHDKAGKLIAAVCAGPTALKAHGIGHGKSLTCYPSAKNTIQEGGHYKFLEDRVVTDGNLITSQGPGTCFEFGVAIVGKLEGEEKAKSLVGPMLVRL